MIRALKLLFACWVAVAATGTAVSHRHTSSATVAHGFGWLAPLSGPADPVVEANPHRHFVLAGVEFGAVPDSNPPAEASRVDPVLDTGHTLADHVALDPPALGSALTFLAHQPVSRATRAGAAPVELCPVARHVRSGVQLS